MPGGQGPWDIPPAWLDQLSANGVLVLPLIMNGVTRTIGFRRDGDHLASTSTEVAGFVPIQGDGQHAERVFLLPDAAGHHVKLRFDDGVPDDLGRLDGVLATERSEQWSGVTIENQTSFADLHLWFAWLLPGFCLLAIDDETELATERGTWFPFGVVRDSAFAYLAVRPALNGAGVEFGARAYGRDGPQATDAMVEHIQAWDRQGRHTSPTFDYWPAGSSKPPTDAVCLRKTHGVVTICWPAGR